jgi:Lon protease-like protein
MKLFLFPLGQSLLHPGSSKPLNIFEPRYLRMVRDSLEERIPIAIGFADHPTMSLKVEKGKVVPFVRDIVGYGYPEVLEQRMDGSMLILIPCEGKAKLGAVIEDKKPYIIAQAERVSETIDLEPNRAIDYLNLQKFLVRWIAQHVTDRQVQDQFVRSLLGPIEVVGAAVNFLIRDPDLQQEILETDNINQKIASISRILLTGQTR